MQIVQTFFIATESETVGTHPCDLFYQGLLIYMNREIVCVCTHTCVCVCNVGGVEGTKTEEWNSIIVFLLQLWFTFASILLIPWNVEEVIAR